MLTPGDSQDIGFLHQEILGEQRSLLQSFVFVTSGHLIITTVILWTEDNLVHTQQQRCSLRVNDSLSYGNN